MNRENEVWKGKLATSNAANDDLRENKEQVAVQMLLGVAITSVVHF